MPCACCWLTWLMCPSAKESIGTVAEWVEDPSPEHWKVARTMVVRSEDSFLQSKGMSQVARDAGLSCESLCKSH
jgi:DNA-binding phage protein